MTRPASPLASFVALVALVLGVGLLVWNGIPWPATIAGAGVGIWLLYLRRARVEPTDTRYTRSGPPSFALSYGLMLAGAMVVALPTPPGVRLKAGLALAIAPAVYYGPVVDQWLRRRSLWTLTIVAGSAIMAYGLAGDMLSAGWGPIDDHEIVHFLGPDRTLRITEISQLWGDLELAHPGVARRYRPSFYVLRVLETFLWGDAPAAWYAVRIAMFGATLALFWRVLARWVGLLPAAIVIGYLLAHGAWVDVWCRLGPSEAYGLLGFALCLEGGTAILRRTRRGPPAPVESRAGWIVLTCGALLAMGAKENFLVILPAVIGLVVFQHCRGRLSWVGITCATVLTIYAALIGAAVVTALLRHGADIYQTPVASHSRVDLLPEAFRRAIAPVVWWDVGLGALLAGAALVWAGRRPPAGVKRIAPELLAILALVALWVSQYVFYGGSWPTGMRYDLPGSPARPLLVVAAVVAMSRAASWLHVDRGLTRALQAGLVAGLLVLTIDHRYAPNLQACAANAEVARAWTRGVDRLVERAHTDPARAIVIVSHDVWDFELVLALDRWLAARQVTNPRFLRISAYETETPMARVLASGLGQLSRGAHGGFRPLSELPSTPRPLGVGLSGLPGEAFEDSGIVWRGAPNRAR